MTGEIVRALSLALGLGLLVGLQRQHAGSEYGGIRTFPIITLLGAICGLLAQQWGGIIVAGGLVGVAATALISNMLRQADDADRAGQTTEAAALLMFACGALLTTDLQPFAIAVAGLTAVLLHSKAWLHQLAGTLTKRDLQAIMRFAVVSLIVLPLVPDTEFGPYDVLNARTIWWMVVLIVGMGLAGYVAMRVFGERAGGWLSGVLGGLVSSTATTVAYARRVPEHGFSVPLAAWIIIIASAVAAARVIVEVAVVAPKLWLDIAPPLAVFLLLLIVASVVMARRSAQDHIGMPDTGNPAELRSAIVFAAVFALVTLASAAASDALGPDAVYIVAIVSGVVDVDAITLSTAGQAANGSMEADIAWRVILIASMTNLIFKTCIAGAIGSPRLFFQLIVPTGAAVIGGTALLVFWP